LLRVNFKNIVTQLETYWFDLRSNVLTRVFNMAESFITCAIKIRESSRPFLSNFFEKSGGIESYEEPVSIIAGYEVSSPGFYIGLFP
jgi:hypothetical protein